MLYVFLFCMCKWNAVQYYYIKFYFQRREFLPQWGISFAKILTMMTGEVNYDDVLHGDDEYDIAFRYILKGVFFAFVIVVVLLLQNLLIGITINDVEKLEGQAKLSHLTSQLEEIFLWEIFVDSLSDNLYRFVNWANNIESENCKFQKSFLKTLENFRTWLYKSLTVTEREIYT